MEFGGPVTAKRQPTYTLDASERDDVTVRVIPFRAGGFPGAGQSVVYAGDVVPGLDVVELDSTHGPEFIDSEMQLHKYRAQLDAVQAAALSPAASRAFTRDIAARPLGDVTVPAIHWEQPFRGEGANCFRLGTDSEGNAHIAVLGEEDRHLTDSEDALRNLLRDIKAGQADHLL